MLCGDTITRPEAAAELSDTDPHGHLHAWPSQVHKPAGEVQVLARIIFDLYPCLSVKIRVPNILADCANVVG